MMAYCGVFLTQAGEYSNGHWLLRPEFVPKSIKKPSKWKEKRNSASLWKKYLVNLQGVVFDKTYDRMGAVRLKTESGQPVLIDKKYHDWLAVIIPDFGLKAQRKKPEKKPLIIFSGDKVAGMIMPWILDPQTVEGK